MNERESLWSWYRADGSLQREGQYARGYGKENGSGMTRQER